jgi:hypothetical protein
LQHFEELWEICEKSHQESGENTSHSSILEEISYKVTLYKTISSRDFSPDELIKLKSRIFGEILFSLTNLSLKDNINVFPALNSAFQSKKG